MKTIIRIFVLFIFINLASAIIPKQIAAHHPVSVSFQVFYDNLSPYGVWVNHSNYGYVWVPNVAGFRPYATNGYWVYTDFGWTWVSNYPWGWAPFHYGRWYYDPIYGDLWVPGYDWGPAWVSWRYYDGYYAWAPLAPGISFGVSYTNYYPPAYRWTVVSYSNFGSTNISNYYVNSSSVPKILSNSTMIQNTQVSNGQTYIAGPAKTEVQRVSGKTVQPVAIQEISKPGMSVSNNKLQIYKPQVQKATGGAKPAPAKVADLKEIKPLKERTASPEKQSVKQQPAQPVRPAPSKSLEQKPRPASPQIRSNENKPQQTQPRSVEPSNKRIEERPRSVSPSERINERPVQPRKESPPMDRNIERKPRPVSPPVNEQRPVQPRNENPPVKREIEQPRNMNPPRDIGGEQQRQRLNNPENVRPPEQPRNIPPPVERPQQPVNPNPPSERPREVHPNLGGEQQQRQMQPPPQQRNMNPPPQQHGNPQKGKPK